MCKELSGRRIHTRLAFDDEEHTIRYEGKIDLPLAGANSSDDPTRVELQLSNEERPDLILEERAATFHPSHRFDFYGLNTCEQVMEETFIRKEIEDQRICRQRPEQMRIA